MAVHGPWPEIGPHFGQMVAFFSAATALGPKTIALDVRPAKPQREACGPGTKWCGLLLKADGLDFQASREGRNGARHRSAVRCLAKLQAKVRTVGRECLKVRVVERLQRGLRSGSSGRSGRSSII
jgi:hypothetical protein